MEEVRREQPPQVSIINPRGEVTCAAFPGPSERRHRRISAAFLGAAPTPIRLTSQLVMWVEDVPRSTVPNPTASALAARYGRSEVCFGIVLVCAGSIEQPEPLTEEQLQAVRNVGRSSR